MPVGAAGDRITAMMSRSAGTTCGRTATQRTPRCKARWFSLAIVLCLVCGLVLPKWLPGTDAAEAWDSASNDTLTVLMEPNERLAASSFLDAYGGFAITAIDEISLLLNATALEQPIILQVYAEGHEFDAAIQALGRHEVDGVIAVADPEHHAILIPLSRFVALIPFDAENQLRHAIAHILFAQTSGFAAPRGFDEGFARYVERVQQPILAHIASVVQSAYQDGSLPSWSNMNRAVPLDDPDLIESQAYAVVGFLLQNYGLAPFQQFVSELQSASTWRDALEIAYAPAQSDDLESKWRDEIPVWAQGDWKWNLVAGFDLQPARDLLARGNFTGASNALLVSEQLFSEIDDAERQAEVAALKDQARIGGLAEAKMQEAQIALENFAYERAAAAIEQAASQYDQLPVDLRPTELIAKYRELAQTGLASTEQLEMARIQSGAWTEYPQARAAAIDAGTGYAALGDSEGYREAVSLIDRMESTQLQLVLLLATMALLTAIWLFVWLRYRRTPGLQWDGQD